MLNSGRHLFLTGEPGSGKSEVIVHAACAAAKSGACVLALCPTGTLVHLYRDRLPDVDKNVVETIHSGFAIQRQYDKLVDYAPPSRLRRYDLILVDEASQIEHLVATLLLMGTQELPQKRTLIGNRGGSAGGLGSQNIAFLMENIHFARHKWRPNKLCRCIGSKNIGFLTRICIFSLTGGCVGGRGNAKY